MLRSMVTTPLGPDEDGRGAGPLMRERLRQRVQKTEHAAAAQLDKLRSRVHKGETAAKAQLDRFKQWVHHGRHNLTHVNETLPRRDSKATAIEPELGSQGHSAAASGDALSHEAAVVTIANADQAAADEAASLTIEPSSADDPDDSKASEEAEHRRTQLEEGQESAESAETAAEESDLSPLE
eukprot:CAMPEP_0178402018 /NCGR_PEP_ID=MMETSP0689_2-20121128/16620_1 /TAXON_ID=160604 /ORGANISM="Amphidinium massartii, Strain CS-259" /LENGTH=181 /DNA_ID=CAMNT_0020022895 /DNA_START=202 /DNA_END=744 /DNA_ORIENTATION=+